MLVTASSVTQYDFPHIRKMPTRSVAKLEVELEAQQKNTEDLAKEVDAMHQCMLRMTRETVDLRRRVDDLESVLMEQFESMSEIGSVVSSVI